MLCWCSKTANSYCSPYPVQPAHATPITWSPLPGITPLPGIAPLSIGGSNFPTSLESQPPYNALHAEEEEEEDDDHEEEEEEEIEPTDEDGSSFSAPTFELSPEMKQILQRGILRDIESKCCYHFSCLVSKMILL
jgi:hypothetical protein